MASCAGVHRHAGPKSLARLVARVKLDGSAEPGKVLIQYFALRDDAGKYLGCIECSQEISRIQAMKGQKRLVE